MATMECMVDAEETSQPNGLANLRYPGVFIQKKKRASMAYRTHSCTGSCSSVDSLESPGATDSRAGMCDSPVSPDSQSQHARSADQLGVLGEGTGEQGLCVPPMEPSAKISFVGQRTSSPRTYISNPELRPQPPSPPVPVPTYYGGCLPHPPAAGSPGPSLVRVGPPALPPPPYPTNRFATASQRHQQPPPPQPPQPPPVPYHLHSPYYIPGPQGPGPLRAPQLGQPPQRPPVARRALFPGAALEPHHSPVMVGPQVGFHSPAPFPAPPPHAVAAPPAPPSTSAAPAAPRPALAAPRGPAGPLRAPVPHSQQLLESLAQLHASAASAEGVPPTSPIVPQDPSSPAAVSGPLVGEDGAVVMLQKVMENSSAPDEKAAVDPRKYKTRLCKNWLEHGECVYAHTCCFAHGPEELRTLVDNHKTLASIGYFSNVVLLAMTNGKKPALPPHSLYQQPPLFSAPTSAKALQECAASVPQEWAFPFRDPLPAALKDLGQDRTTDVSVKRKGHRGKSHRNVYGANGGRARGGRAAQVAASEDYGLDSEVTA